MDYIPLCLEQCIVLCIINMFANSVVLTYSQKQISLVDQVLLASRALFFLKI
ncbi:hypothetical protein VIBNISOn1_p0115 [Vibrio nigripulchritudo SOn1]|uniref:Uncharacterized protein n=1 Tax=Vibrio nigripulchritudo SOn1 TaxID=1238450 RepID=A0AAV2W1V5_9VIBR|nr:hypothetical protein VIBNISOn1_p0115 [Vibrio nigripulchritudo SOn1]